MKEKLTNNIGLKLLSLMVATLLWLVVVNSQDPLETRTFSNIPVTIINEDSLIAKDKIPEVIEGDRITVVVEARRKICDMLTDSDIAAVADFSKISLTDAVPIEVSVKGYSDTEVEIIRGMNQVMTLRLEDSITKDFRVKIATSGETAEGYVIGDMVASPNMITLTGSSTQISKIKEVVLMVDIEGISKEFQATGMPLIYDMNGDVVNSSKVTMSAESVMVTVPVLKTRIVKINVNTIGEPFGGYEVTDISYQPKSVTIAGTPSDLVMLGSSLQAYCDVTDCTEDLEENIDITGLWSPELESLRLVDDEKLAVTITISEYEEKVMELTGQSIIMYDLREDLNCIVRSVTPGYVTVKGSREALEGITINSLMPYIELDGYVFPGIYTVPVTLDNLGDLILTDVIFAEIEIYERLGTTIK